MSKPKVLILYNKLFHYRIPIWNILAKYYDLTVTYTSGDEVKVPDDVSFNVIYLPAIIKSSRFVLQRANIRKFARGYDVVIAYGDISWLKFSTLPWFNKKPIIFWTLGVSASYDSGYDGKSTWDKIRVFFYRQADALAFYTQYPIEKYSRMGIPSEKMFEAPNTVAVAEIDTSVPKDSLLFIGTLYRQKGLQYLLDAYKENRDNPNILPLNIIGSGPDYDDIKSWISDNKLDSYIFLRGAIYENAEKAGYFSRAVACISPKQAGLSVLESMGYGVPFITTRDAITGGEIFNVHHGIDGIIMESTDDLTLVLKDIFNNRDKYLKFGKAAKTFYDNNRTPEHMAGGLIEAINYVLEKNKE